MSMPLAEVLLRTAFGSWDITGQRAAPLDGSAPGVSFWKKQRPSLLRGWHAMLPENVFFCNLHLPGV